MFWVGKWESCSVWAEIEHCVQISPSCWALIQTVPKSYFNENFVKGEGLDNSPWACRRSGHRLVWTPQVIFFGRVETYLALARSGVALPGFGLLRWGHVNIILAISIGSGSLRPWLRGSGRLWGDWRRRNVFFVDFGLDERRNWFRSILKYASD